MKNEELSKEILKYIEDDTYRYAVMIDGEWGCGKTYYVKNELIPTIEDHEKNKNTDEQLKVGYVSLYGQKNLKSIQELVATKIISDFEISQALINIKNLPEEEGKRRLFTRTGETIKSFANALRNKVISEINLFDLIGGVDYSNKYIWVFDDLERCDCPVNEVLGFINSLVEHSNTKVIIVANENEINYNFINKQSELRYLVASQATIFCQHAKKEMTPDGSNSKFDVNELNKRKEEIFTETDLDAYYSRVREKLIGLTYKYEPSVYTVIEELVQNNESLDKCLKDAILDCTDYIIDIMKRLNHNNVRTLQFFVIKIKSVYEKLIDIEVKADCFSSLLDEIVKETFFECAWFKSNSGKNKSIWELAGLHSSNFSSIKTYVETGTLIDDEFESEINRFVSANIEAILPSEDPWQLIQSSYWMHDEVWLQAKIDELINNIRNNYYSHTLYGRQMRYMMRFEEIGLEGCVEKTKTAMLNTIGSNDFNLGFETEIHFEENPDNRNRLATIGDELNTEASKQSTKEKQQSVHEMISSENWAERLHEHTESDEYKNSSNQCILEKADKETWISLLKTADSRQLTEFRYAIYNIFPRNQHKTNMEGDLEVIKALEESVDDINAQDKILKMNLSFLKTQLNEILQYYNH